VREKLEQAPAENAEGLSSSNQHMLERIAAARARPESNIMAPDAGGVTIGLIGILIRNDGRSVSAGATIIFSAGVAHVAVFFSVRTTELMSYAAKVPTRTKGVTGWLNKINLSIALGPLIATPAGQVSD
jgi:hypothetical protein